MSSLFQQKVYEVVRRIPAGEVLTYKEIALKIGKPNAFRAVGNALHKNRNPAVPCHRVVRSDGKVGGYNRGSAEKAMLLKKEGVVHR